ncbi:MAG: hypothetical protein IMF08_05400 [Proteobacteria bacterium]|nr:hypothetical protein [Pseudomonadota bacterium]
MARIVQIFGWAFLLLGVMTGGLMGIMAVNGPPLTDKAGAVWNKFHGFSLMQFQVFVQRTLGMPDLWDNYVVLALQAPAWLSMTGIVVASFILGALLLLSARSRRRAGIIHQSGHMS